MLSKIKQLLKQRAYRLLERPYELNMIALRSKQSKPGMFAYEIHLLYKDTQRWHYHLYKACTDPGSFCPKEQADTFHMLKAGQYENSFELTEQQGIKKLIANKALPVLTGYQRENYFDFTQTPIEQHLEQIEILPAERNKNLLSIPAQGIATQVFRNQSDYEQMLKLAEVHIKYYGNHLSYTLIDFREEQRAYYKRLGKRVALMTELLSELLKSRGL